MILSEYTEINSYKLMLNKIFSNEKFKHKQLNILIVEPERGSGSKLANFIKTKRPKYKILIIDNLEQIFSLLYGEIKIDVVFFDIATEPNTDNLTLLKAIEPKISLIHWSNCQHPEIIEFLYILGINSFCFKKSNPKSITEAIDLATYYPQSLYIDEKLHNCLPLLKS